MPPKATKAGADPVRAFSAHGITLKGPNASGQYEGDCPFCGKAKFFVNAENGLWDCKVCGASGNPQGFLRRLWEESDKATADYDGLAEGRGYVYPDSLMAWGVCRSAVTGEWLFPGFDGKGRLTQLYRYQKDGPGGKMVLKATPGLPHAIHGVDNYDPAKGDVYLLEGPWDGVSWWEALRFTKRNPDGSLGLTANDAASLYKDANVLAAPGQSVFQAAWLPLFAGKRVFIAYDSDHPKENPKTGQPIPPAGWEGAKRVAGILAAAEEPPKEIHVLKWGPAGFDPDRKSGWDVRDHLNQAGTPGMRVPLAGELLSKFTPIPNGWVEGRSKASVKAGSPELACLPCSSWDDLVRAWRKAMKWTEGLDRALSCMLATVISTEQKGDQLWMKIVGPASCGKSVLCEALSVNKEFTIAKSTIRGFHSGFQVDPRGKEDASLIHAAKGKTLITKDGDTLLTSPNLDQVLAEGRDVYDCVSRTHYRNKMSRDYEGHRMTWLLCGTASLRDLDSSELGERFLDCVVVKDMPEDLEREIGWRVARRAFMDVGSSTNCTIESQDNTEMTAVKQLTGGYVGYLRGNAERLIGAVGMSDAALDKIQDMAEFVAFMRSRPSTRQDEKVEREMSFRLTVQLVRLARCLGAVLGKAELDDEVMRRVLRVARDTADGKTVNLARLLYASGAEGTTVSALSTRTGDGDAKVRELLKFLRGIKVAEFLEGKQGGPKPRWRLTERLQRLWKEVMLDEHGREV